MIEKYKRLFKASQEPLSDSEYLEIMISDCYRFHPNNLYSLKDLSSTYIAASPIVATMCGFDDVDSMLGTRDESLKCTACEIAEIFIKQDRQVERSKEPKHFLNIIKYTTGLTVLKATNSLLGTFSYCTQLIPDFSLDHILSLHNKKFGAHSNMDIVNSHREYHLSTTEAEVLFCVCLGFSEKKSIANFLSFIHKRDVKAETTVNDAIRSLYRKTSCNNTFQLLEFSVANKLHLQIPKVFIKLGSFEINHN